MNLDITFCSKKNCKDKECLRNQNNYDLDEKDKKNVSITWFKECEKWGIE